VEKRAKEKRGPGESVHTRYFKVCPMSVSVDAFTHHAEPNPPPDEAVERLVDRGPDMYAHELG